MSEFILPDPSFKQMNEQDLISIERDKEIDNIINNTCVGSNPSKFGSPTWKFLHLYSLRYPLHPTDEQKYNEKMFLESIFQRLGCANCVIQMVFYIIKHPIALGSRKELVWWLFQAHNHVNVKLKRKEMTKQEFVDVYLQHNNKLTRNQVWKNISIILFIMVFLMLITFIYFKVNKSNIL